ncbi:MAG TPA: long-chain fatty acid--CoA ligase [Solirubrobacterales bacterium]|nr:long-chain fatty acid--CoA ligase [Solirubrobacterales bacterium]
MSVYDEKPWLAHYPEGAPETIEIPFETGLEMFQATLERIPDAPAIHYFDRAISFREIDEVSSALAVALQDLGFQRGDRLASYLQNVPQFPIAMLATWKAGGTMVSVNPMLKGREAATILNDSGARALITLESLWRDVARDIVDDTPVSIPITTSELDFLGDGETPALLAGCERDRDEATHDLVDLVSGNRGRAPEPSGLKADDIAFLTYTSGTTGPPKGAMNSHANVVFNARSYQTWGDLGEQDVILAVAPLFHITGLIAHIGLSFLSGAPQVLFFRFDPEAALELIEIHRATFTVASITVYISLMNAPGAGSRDVSSFTKILSGGAPIAPATVEAYEGAMGAYIHNVYGLTETTSPSHFVPLGVKAPVDEESGALSVGLPIFNTMVRIRDDEDNDLPAGEVGEIVTSGPQVVSGYWNKPEETEHAIPGGELHTGDVGVMDPDGWFYVVDRKKDQINAAGYKVWPREVEDVVYGHEAVQEVAVIGVPDEYRGETVKAFVSLKPGAELSDQELIAFCKERLAAYKYPRQIEFVDELPKTASGKVLRRELRDREASKA